MSPNVTADFIFGTLATDDLRLDALRTEAASISHRSRTDPVDPEPGQPVMLIVNTGPAIPAVSVSAIYTIDGGEPGPDSARLTLEPAEVVWDTLIWGYRRVWRGTLPPQPAGTLVRYQIFAGTADGERVGADPAPPTGRPPAFAYHVDRERLPDWARDAVIYQVFVDRFAPGEGRDWTRPSSLAGIWGGTLRGVIERLPYLERLGVTCLWLSPIFPSPTHHGYDATDYLQVEPRLGTDNDLVELFAAAHERGLRVLLDFVANHVSDEHPAFQRAASDPAAPERTWFTFSDGSDEYASFFGVRSMPQLNTDDPGARDYLIRAATHWLERGADGFRLDYAHGASHAFWAAFRAATRAAKPDSFTVGEIVETAELQRSYEGRLDGALDFLLLQQLRAFFAFDMISAAELDTFLTGHLGFFGTDFALPSFLDNHDMNRFLWVAGGDVRRLKLAALCQFTLPHPPIIYYGTEAGLSQGHDLEYPDGSRRPEESRAPMLWDDAQDQALLTFYTDLIALRRRYASLWRGARRPLVASDGGLYAVAVEHADRRAIVALNRSESERRIHVPPGLAVQLATGRGVEFARDELRLPAMTGAIMLNV